MSPYGSSQSKPPRDILASTAYSNSSGSIISVHHVNKTSCPQELLQVLHEEFEKELEIGRTYPQEGPIGYEGFREYFFQGDVFIGIIIAPETIDYSSNGKIIVPNGVEAARDGREWKDCVAGSYYVKDNYPGRSSHICNAGFVVLSRWRGRKYGSLLGQSYLHYAPLLGYRASIFNLVYMNNVASIRIWERLGFKRVGTIPEAGRLKTSDGNGEEYVDAAVYWKSFLDVDEAKS